MNKRWTALSLTTVLALVIPGAGAGAQTPEPASESQPLYWHIDPDGDGPLAVGHEVHNSSTAIWRDEGGVSFEVRTTGLVKGHGLTVWFFSYDNPEACIFGNGNEGTRCTRADLLLNPAAQGSLMWGRAGEFVSSNGLTTFTGRRPANTTPCVTEPAVVDEDCSGVLIGRGLLNPLGAEIHFMLRDHGPDQEGIEDETTTINGGCDPLTYHGLPGFGPGWGTPGNFACYDPQGNA